MSVVAAADGECLQPRQTKSASTAAVRIRNRLRLASNTSDSSWLMQAFCARGMHTYVKQVYYKTKSA
jgi:hypothetical protein